jgi:hypothetical protein
MDTIWPPATQLILPEAQTQETIVPVLVIYHTIVGSAAGAIRMMQGDWNGESHLVNPFDGRMVQLMPFNVRADCNWRVNSWITQVDIPMANGVIVPRGTRCGAISIESEDDGTPEDTPWTFQQIESFAQFSAWAYTHLNIPLDRPTDPFQAGTGYHSLPGLNRLAAWEPTATPPYGTFIDSKGRVVNVYNPWTNTVGKSCPGPARIAQFDTILARARAIVDPPPAPTVPLPQPEDHMHVLHLKSKSKGEWIWAPGGEPQPFKTPADATAITTALGGIPTCEVSDAQLIALCYGEKPPK